MSCGKIMAVNMALDLKKLFNRRYDFEFNLPTLGWLHCRVLSTQVLNQVEKMLADKDLTGRPFIVKLLEQVAERSPAGGETEPETKQEGTPVTAAEAERLTDEEIEPLQGISLLTTVHFWKRSRIQRGRSGQTKKVRGFR